MLKSLKALPKVVILHHAIDTERKTNASGVEGDKKTTAQWENIQKIKSAFPKSKMLVAVAGG